VGCGNNGDAKAGFHLIQEGDDLLTRLQVEVAGRLVGQHDQRLVHERTRNRNTLLLPARDL